MSEKPTRWDWVERANSAVGLTTGLVVLGGLIIAGVISQPFRDFVSSPWVLIGLVLGAEAGGLMWMFFKQRRRDVQRATGDSDLAQLSHEVAQLRIKLEEAERLQEESASKAVETPATAPLMSFTLSVVESQDSLKQPYRLSIEAIRGIWNDAVVRIEGPQWPPDDMFAPGLCFEFAESRDRFVNEVDLGRLDPGDWVHLNVVAYGGTWPPIQLFVFSRSKSFQSFRKAVT